MIIASCLSLERSTVSQMSGPHRLEHCLFQMDDLGHLSLAVKWGCSNCAMMAGGWGGVLSACFQVSLCTPSENTPTESLARLVAMVFQWFHSTAYMMDDEVGSLVEKLKPQFVTKWLKTVCDVRFDVMVMCLLPKPMEFARVSGGLPLGPGWRGGLGGKRRLSHEGGISAGRRATCLVH